MAEKLLAEKPERKVKVNLQIKKKKRAKKEKPARKHKAKKRNAFKPTKLKLARTTSKLKTFIRKSMKAALKGKNVSLKVYKKADIAIAKSEEVKTAIQAAVVSCVHNL